ncbi:MAG: ATPase, T2SS/T4P/T4SS family [Rhodoferax sp.]
MSTKLQHLGLETAASPQGRGAGFFWPCPPYATYSVAEPWFEPQPCEIEGLNGKVRRCTLVAIWPAEQAVEIRLDSAQSTLSVGFAQFRRITLKAPLAPQTVAREEQFSDMLSLRPVVRYRLELNNGQILSGDTVGYVETAFGLFLFAPLDDGGTVERVFVPRAAYLNVQFGDPVGQLLVAQNAATPEQVELAAAQQEALRQRKLGDYLIEQAVVTPDALLAALEKQAQMPLVRVGEALTLLGYITPEQLRQALQQQQRERNMPLGQLLIQLGFITRHDLNVALARKMGYPLVDVSVFPIEPEALRRIALPTAQRLAVLPLLARQGLTVVASADPTRREMIDELEFVTQGRVVAALGDEVAIAEAMLPAYQRVGLDEASPRDSDAPEPDPQDASSAQLLEWMALQDLTSEEPDVKDDPVMQSDNTLVRLVNSMIIEAARRGVSDIHVECQPRREKVRIRFRQDGQLSLYLELPHNYRAAVVARLKIMANLDISEKRKPQDGKIDFRRFSPKHRLELRVATIPTTAGLEDVVLRLLSSAKPMPLDQLGLSPDNLANLRAAVSRPYGMVLCVGPTGSGKTTTLHSVLRFLNTPERKIWTAEDPVEITQPDLRQVQINPAIDWTFAKALRAFLRADPDVIMVGEIRDEETAQMAIEASLTGHLLLSTLHTNSAAETITRLTDMGMNPFNFADSLLAVLAQRLVRRLCPKCVKPEPAPQAWIDELVDDYRSAFPEGVRPAHDAVLAQWQTQFAGGLHRHVAPGCAHCNGSGYAGRVGVHELLISSPGLRRLIQTGASSERIQSEAFVGGHFRTLRQDGLLKVLAGLTSLDEVRANTNA